MKDITEERVLNVGTIYCLRVSMSIQWVNLYPHTGHGAGVSVASGIPDFRSPGGLWGRCNPSVYASINRFREDPERVWTMLFEMIAAVDAAESKPPTWPWPRWSGGACCDAASPRK
ncbi:MAG: hypothetical protein JXA20_00990 [Spirochaetes bacterium]|nr:hypothetical protein [Spirochaetota bacterium]